MTKKVSSQQMESLRTQLANERTFLAFERTAITFLIAGITIIKLLGDGGVFDLIGWLLIIISPAIIFSGIKQKKQTAKICSLETRD